jgi:hypothetical protein
MMNMQEYFQENDLALQNQIYNEYEFFGQFDEPFTFTISNKNETHTSIRITRIFNSQ